MQKGEVNPFTTALTSFGRALFDDYTIGRFMYLPSTINSNFTRALVVDLLVRLTTVSTEPCVLSIANRHLVPLSS